MHFIDTWSVDESYMSRKRSGVSIDNRSSTCSKTYLGGGQCKQYTVKQLHTEVTYPIVGVVVV